MSLRDIPEAKPLKVQTDDVSLCCLLLGFSEYLTDGVYESELIEQ